MNLFELLICVVIVGIGAYSFHLRARISPADDLSWLSRCWRILAPVVWSTAIVAIVILVLGSA